MRSKTFARLTRQKLWQHYINRLLCLSIAISIVILGSQLPSWGKAGLSEWQERTPGGNKIGNTEVAVGVGLRGNRGGHLDRIGDYGFYDGVVIGTTESTGTERYFLFDEQSNKIEFFNTKQELCKRVDGKSRIVDRLIIICFCAWYAFCFLSGFIISLRHYWHSHGAGLKFNLNKALDDPRFEQSLFGWVLGIFVSPTIVNPFAGLVILAICWVLWKMIFVVLMILAEQLLIMEDYWTLRSKSTTVENGKFRSIRQCALFVSVFIFGVSGFSLAIAALTDNSFRC